MVSDDAISKEYDGTAHPRLDTRKSAGHAKSVRSINDAVSGFSMYTDNGIHAVDMKRVKRHRSCRKQKADSYFFEKNQEGGGWSFSLTLANFSISYAGSGGMTLKKAAKYNYF